MIQFPIRLRGRPAMTARNMAQAVHCGSVWPGDPERWLGEWLLRVRVPPTDHLEREFKLEAELHFTLPDLRSIVGDVLQLPEQSLRTRYFDSPDLRLWTRGITLRHRAGEEPSGGLWTMKLPEVASGTALERTELSWSGAGQEVPSEAVALLKGIVRHARLNEVLDLESTRRRLVLGSTFGELDDDIVTVKSGSRKGYMFRQIELEVENGPSVADQRLDAAEAVVARLREAGARVTTVNRSLPRRWVCAQWRVNQRRTPMGPPLAL